jgi:hypothetical protein
VSARRLPTLVDGAQPRFLAICEIFVDEGCGTTGAIGAASLEPAYRGCAACREEPTNEVALVPCLVALQDMIAALLSLFNLAQCLEPDLGERCHQPL